MMQAIDTKSVMMVWCFDNFQSFWSENAVVKNK